MQSLNELPEVLLFEPQLGSRAITYLLNYSTTVDDLFLKLRPAKERHPQFSSLIDTIFMENLCLRKVNITEIEKLLGSDCLKYFAKEFSLTKCHTTLFKKQLKSLYDVRSFAGVIRLAIATPDWLLIEAKSIVEEMAQEKLKSTINCNDLDWNFLSGLANSSSVLDHFSALRKQLDNMLKSQKNVEIQRLTLVNSA